MACLPLRRLELQQKLQLLSQDEYLGRFGILDLLSDMVEHVIDSKSGDSIQECASYFDRVLLGSHVVGRTFAFCRSHPLGRLCLANRVSGSISQLESLGDVQQADFLAMCTMHCVDFPQALLDDIWAAHELGASLRTVIREAIFFVDEIETCQIHLAKSDDVDSWSELLQTLFEGKLHRRPGPTIPELLHQLILVDEYISGDPTLHPDIRVQVQKEARARFAAPTSAPPPPPPTKKRRRRKRSLSDR